MLNIVVIGSEGQLGTELMTAFGPQEQVTGLSHEQIEITDHERTAETIRSLAPDVVINTAAFHNVDLCETEAEQAFSVNALAVHALGRVCDDIGARIVNISTDYVFSGTSSTPNVEDDLVAPISVYGASKAAGESLLRVACKDHVIIRTSGLYGPAGTWNRTGNFVEKMISLASEGRDLKVVDDQVTAPTYTPDLAGAIRQLILEGVTGTFHVTNGGSVSWYQFARQIFDELGIDASISPVDSVEFGAKAARPACSVLSNDRFTRATGQRLRAWDEALPEYLETRSKRLDASSAASA